MTKRKYLSEFGLNMVSGYCFLIQQDHLDLIDQTGVDPHIYIVGRRPKISLNPSSVAFEKDYVSGEFRKQIKDKYVSIPFKTRNMLGTHEVTLKCEYPYTEYEIIESGGNAIAGGKCALLLASFGFEYWEHMDLEVLYIGQAYGKDGSRNAADRLKKHETLQGIYSEAIKNSPDCDIWLILCTFEPLMLASFDGRQKEYVTTIEQDTGHIKEVANADITEQQQINFTEASLIRYFQPSYNKIYKKSFPNPAHSTYSECYDIDLNMVSTEIQTEDIGLRLWSESVAPEWVHFSSFPLHSKKERMYMFDI